MNPMEAAAEARTSTADARELALARFLAVRQLSEQLCLPLVTEDFVVQSMPDVSPPKWHIGHTTWFFERVLLQEFEPDFRPIDERLYYVFNSYYQSFGERVARVQRGTLSRPTVDQVMDYRKRITERVQALVPALEDDKWARVAPLLELGCQHEQQHQELFVYDIKHILAASPFYPVYRPRSADAPSGAATPRALKYIAFEGGMLEIGADGHGFAYDNELPRHRAYTAPFLLADRPTTCGEYLEFIEAGGYQDHRLWLSDGWDWLNASGAKSPLYWQRTDDGYRIWTLSGWKPLDSTEPVCHVNYYEATAFARWAGRRLPTEIEWESAARAVRSSAATGTMLEEGRFHPAASAAGSGSGADGLRSLFGDVWEWTQSAYLPYPGYRQTRDPLGEYNGKFMSNQMVLRGGSCATPRDHIRPSYRNFFQCDKRWPFTGIRLADEV